MRAPYKQEVCFSIQSGNNQVSQASETILVADRSVTSWFAIALAEIRSRRILREKADCKQSSSKLRSTHLTVSFKTFKVFTCLETGALSGSSTKFFFPKNTEPHNLWCLPHRRHCTLPSVLVWPYRGRTYLTNAQCEGSFKSDRSIQAKGEKVKYVNKTGISADQCTWLLTSVIWFLFPSDKNGENYKTGKDEQYTKVIMDKIWQASLLWHS